MRQNYLTNSCKHMYLQDTRISCNLYQRTAPPPTMRLCETVCLSHHFSQELKKEEIIQLAIFDATLIY